MDDDGLNMKNWGYYEPSIKGNLGLQLMSSMVDREPKPFMSGRDSSVMAAANGVFRPGDYLLSGHPDHMDTVKDNWMYQREKFYNMFGYNNGLPETSGSHQMQIIQQPDPVKDTREKVEEVVVKKESSAGKKRAAVTVPKTPKSKKSKKSPAATKVNGNSSGQRTKAVKRNMEFEINGIDISGIPIPVCSCTGTPQQCYRWGCGGWQSACCTTSISMYPLPMSTKRRGARIAGRKMSQGAFKKVLEKLVSEGYNFANAIDLRSHWAKHGTNKFVIIR